MNTETTENIKGWVGYDAECGFCRRWADRTHDVLAGHGWHLVPLQAGWVRARLGIKAGDLLAEMKLITAGGLILGGVDALIHLAQSIWWAWPLFVLAQVPGVKPVLRAVYRRIARSRHCLASRCKISSHAGIHVRHGAGSFYEIP